MAIIPAIHVHVHGAVHVHLASDADVAEIKQGLRVAHQKLDALLTQGARLMTQAQEITQILDDIDAKTNDSAAKLTEVNADIDDILAQLEGGVSPADADAIKARLQNTKNTLTAQAELLTAIAAKHETPAEPA